jgi:hypothetical protein
MHLRISTPEERPKTLADLEYSIAAPVSAAATTGVVTTPTESNTAKARTSPTETIRLQTSDPTGIHLPFPPIQP